MTPCSAPDADDLFKAARPVRTRPFRPTLRHTASSPPGLPAENIPNHLVWAILTTLCCCTPFGVVSIVHAAQVNEKLARGDIPGAWDSSAKAKTWAWIAFGAAVGPVVAILVIGMLWRLGRAAI